MLQGLLPHTLNLCRHTHSLLAEQHKQLSYVILVKGMFVCICIQMLVCVCLCVCFWCGGSILKGIVCGKKKEGGRKFICGQRTQKTNWGSVVLMCRGQQQTHAGFWLTATWVACLLSLCVCLSLTHPQSALKPRSHPSSQTPPPPPRAQTPPHLSVHLFVRAPHICLHCPSDPPILYCSLFHTSPLKLEFMMTDPSLSHSESDLFVLNFKKKWTNSQQTLSTFLSASNIVILSTRLSSKFRKVNYFFTKSISFTLDDPDFTLGSFPHSIFSRQYRSNKSKSVIYRLSRVSMSTNFWKSIIYIFSWLCVTQTRLIYFSFIQAVARVRRYKN